MTPALGFKTLFACFLACVILRFTSGVTRADCIEVSVEAKLFQPTYLQIMCPQALGEIRTYDRLCRTQHSAVVRLHLYGAKTKSDVAWNGSIVFPAVCLHWEATNIKENYFHFRFRPNIIEP